MPPPCQFSSDVRETAACRHPVDDEVKALPLSIICAAAAGLLTIRLGSSAAGQIQYIL